MLYGTLAASQTLARLTIAARVVAGSPVTCFGGEPGLPAGPCSGPEPPCGVGGSSEDGSPGLTGPWSDATAGTVCAPPMTVPAAAARTRARRAPWAAGWPPRLIVSDDGELRAALRQ